jgi:hypothetical protein
MRTKKKPEKANEGNAMLAEGGSVALCGSTGQPKVPRGAKSRHVKRITIARLDFAPTDRETALVARRLGRALGSFWRLELLTGLPAEGLAAVARGARRAGIAERRLLWVLWFLLEYPDGIRTVFDLATCGRFSPIGRQAWAQLLERGPEFAEVRRLRRWGSPFDFLETVGEIVARARWRLYKEREKGRRRGGGDARRRAVSARQDAG